jgi:hypothetical protein
MGPLSIMSRLLLSFVFASMAAASLAAESTFDVNAEGWQTCNVEFGLGPTVADDFTPASYRATEGNPPGSIAVGDTLGGWGFFAAPSKFLGDQSTTFGGALSFDTYSTSSDGVVFPAAILTSGTTAIFAFSMPPDPTWTNVAIPLSGAAWSLSPTVGGLPISDALLQSVLSNLDGLYIEADWLTQPTETTGLDNVRLAAVPEPASMAALGLGLAAILRRRK